MASETTSLSERFGGLTPHFSEKAGRLASRPVGGRGKDTTAPGQPVGPSRGEGRTPRPPARHGDSLRRSLIPALAL